VSGLTYRAATLDDVPAIMRGRAADPEWGPADPRTGAYLEGAHHPQQALAPRVAFAAFDGDAVVGYVTGHLTRRYECDGELQTIWVAPDHRRCGVATMLLALLARWFVEHDARRVCVDVEPDNAVARAFYTRHGAETLNRHWLVWPDFATAAP
jgi:ribosomal protein S18 acetylase RimI-like enzyme